MPPAGVELLSSLMGQPAGDIPPPGPCQSSCCCCCSSVGAVVSTTSSRLRCRSGEEGVPGAGPQGVHPGSEDVEGAEVVSVPPVARAVGVAAPQEVVNVLPITVFPRMSQAVPSAARAHRRRVGLVHQKDGEVRAHAASETHARGGRLVFEVGVLAPVAVEDGGNLAEGVLDHKLGPCGSTRVVDAGLSRSQMRLV